MVVFQLTTQDFPHFSTCQSKIKHCKVKTKSVRKKCTTLDSGNVTSEKKPSIISRNSASTNQNMFKSVYTSAIIAAAFLSVIHAASTKPDKDRSQALSKAHFEFSLNLYRGLANSIDPGEGFVYSPYCINLALSMLFLGTRSASETSNQFRRVLGYEGISYVDVHTAFKVRI